MLFYIIDNKTFSQRILFQPTASSPVLSHQTLLHASHLPQEPQDLQNGSQNRASQARRPHI